MNLRKRMLEDLDQDIREHIERETQDNIERGMSPEALCRHAEIRQCDPSKRRHAGSVDFCLA
jgi:hypothetical protein